MATSFRSITDELYPIFPVFTFLGFLATTIPLRWHLAAWNSGTCYFMIWTALINLNQFVNSVVWHNNALNPAPIWCDISVRIMLAGSIGLPASSLCIHRRLYSIATIQSVAFTRAEKRRLILIDSLICVLFPLIIVGLQYIVQGHRFNIYEDIGCTPSIYNTAISFPIYHMWPLLIGTISAVYCTLSLRAFLKRRADFNQFLSSSHSNFNIGRYFRLMAMACTELCLVVPLNIVSIYLNLSTQQLEPWRSWADTHYNFSRVDQIPAIFWHSNRLLVVSNATTRWSAPFAAIIFFMYFGFAEEARQHYRQAFWSILKPFGLLPRVQQKSGFIVGTNSGGLKKAAGRQVSVGSLPPYSPPHTPIRTPISAKSHHKRINSLSSSVAETVCAENDAPFTPTRSEYSLPSFPFGSTDTAHVIPLTPIKVEGPFDPTAHELSPSSSYRSLNVFTPTENISMPLPTAVEHNIELGLAAVPEQAPYTGPVVH